jgi:hypothetical protein
LQALIKQARLNAILVSKMQSQCSLQQLIIKRSQEKEAALKSKLVKVESQQKVQVTFLFRIY